MDSQFSWNDLRQSRASTSIPLILSPTSTYSPINEWSVEIYETDGSRVWIGTIQGTDIRWIGNDGWRIMTLTCVGLMKALDGTQLPAKKYANPVSCGSLLTEQFAFVQSGALTLGTISAGATIPNIDVSGTYKDLADRCALLSGYVAFINPRDATFNFVDPTTNPAAYIVDSSPGMILWESLRWKESADDQRDQQLIQVAAGTTGSLIDVFDGDGTTTVFTLSASPAAIVSAVVTGSTRASVTGTFTATNATPGDTVTIGSATYMYVSVLNNDLFGEVLVGATSQDSAKNLVDAINAKPSQSGITYSIPTWANLSVTSAQPTGSPARTFIIYARILGNNGNGIVVSESTSGFTWSSGVTSGGMDALPSGTYQIDVATGNTAVNVYPAMPVGTTAVVQYYPSTAPLISVGFGPTMRKWTLDNASPTQEAAVQVAQAALNTFNGVPATSSYESDVPGLFVCDYVPVGITYPITAPARLNGNWILQEVQAVLIPGKDTLQAPYNHFRYTYELVNSLGVPPFTQFIDALAAVGNSDPQVMEPVNPTVIPTGTRIAQLTLCDLTVGDDIAAHTIVTTPYTTTSPITHSEDQGVRILGELRLTLSSDLTVRINKYTLCTSPPSTTQYTVTIPSGTPAKTVLLTTITGQFCDGDVLSADVVASDGQTDANGVAVFTLEWEP